EPVPDCERVEITCDVETERQSQDLTLAEELERSFRWIRIEQPEVLLQHLAEGPVRDPVSVREAPAGSSQRLGLHRGQQRPQLADEPGLSDTGVTEERHELRSARLDRGLEAAP